MSTTGLIVFVIFFIFGIIGFSKGFLRKIFTVVTLLACILIAGALTTPVSNWAKTTPVYDGINSQVYSALDSQTAKDAGMSGTFSEYGGDTALSGIQRSYVSNNASGIAAQVNSYIGNLKLPSNIQNSITVTGNDIVKQASETGASYKKIVLNSVSEKISDILLKILVYLGICLIVYIIMRIIFAAAGLAKKFVVVSMVDRFGGLIVGLAEGLLVVWIFMAVITLCAGIPFGQNALSDVSSNEILSVFYNNNLLWAFLK